VCAENDEPDIKYASGLVQVLHFSQLKVEAAISWTF
jgi:hypothetical protein